MSFTAYDPKACGARCGECQLKGSTVVPPEHAPGATVLLVGEAPGPEDILQGKAFAGRSGEELETALSRLGIHRSQVSLTHTLLCRPEDNDLKRLLKKIKAQNKARKERGEPLKLTPLDYCKQRLLNEIREHHYVVAMGKEAHQGCSGLKEPILRVRGTMQELMLPGEEGKPPHRFKYLPTVHPVMVSRMERWRGPFRSDLAKAWRYFNDQLDWDPPELIYNPDPATLRALLLTEEGLRMVVGGQESQWSTPRFPPDFQQGRRWHAYDLETQHKLSGLDARLRCMAIGTEKWAVVISRATIEETRRWWREHHRGQAPLPEKQTVYDGASWAEVQAVLDEWGQHPEIVKVGWNSGYYDANVWFQWRGYKPSPALDLIMAWRDCASELPKSLGFVGTYLLDAPDWKGDHTATTTESDQELWRYNGFDTVITARLVKPTIRILTERGQGHHLEPNHKVQSMCLDMHRNGLWVNQERRERTERWLEAVRSATERTCREIAAKYGVEDHNPRSFPQVGRLLYDVWEYLPPYETDDGEPSTGEDALLALLRDRRCTKDHSAYIEALLLHRNVAKRHSTYCKPMRREDRWWRAKRDTAQTFTEAAILKGMGEMRHGRVMLSDFRIHPGYSAHTVVSHRLSSVAINAQNIEKVFRYLIQPQPLAELEQLFRSGWLHVLWGRLAGLGPHTGPLPGWLVPGDARFERIFVGADMDQLELRVSAAMADCDSYLQVFKDGGDPHAITARLLFGNAFLRELQHLERTGKKTGAYTAMRNTAKVFVYLVTYGGSAETAWKGITAYVDPTGKRPYAHMKLSTVVKYREAWLRGAPEYEAWWARTQYTFRRQGYLSDPVDGVRRDFLDGEDFNELVNHSVQAAGYAVVRRATERLLEVFPQQWCWENWGPGSGLVTQTHDANMAEVPRYAAEKYRAVMEDCMTLRVPGLDVPFTAEARISPDWANAC